MKKVFLAVACVALLASCSAIRKSSVSTLDVASGINSGNTADLVVSPTKISYTYVPTGNNKKSGLKNVLNNAITDALKENGNADVLVHMNYDAIMKKSGKVKKLTVTGYPAKYQNFQSK